MGDQGLAAWKLPLIVSAIAISIVTGFYLGGPGLGMAVGGLAAGTIIVMAIRNPPRYPIEAPPPTDLRDHLLVVVEEPLEDAPVIEAVAAVADDAAEVLVLAPARSSFLDRWACDTGPGRERAQRNLVLSLASLAGAGVAARACIGDEDVVQSVADRLQDYPATEVLLVSGPREDDAAAAELRGRLRPRFRHLRCAGGGVPTGALSRRSNLRSAGRP